MIYRFGGFELDRARFRLARGHEPVRLKPQVLELVAYLVERHGKLVTRQELLRELWNDRFVGEAALTSCVYEARRALGDAEGEQGGDGSQRFIQTVHGRGYRFAAAVETFDDAGRRIAGPEPRASAPDAALSTAAPSSTAVPDAGLAAPVPASDAHPPVVAREREPSIAVLAFADMSPGRDQAYFAEGTAEAIINALATVDGLRVMARTSAFALSRQNLTAQEIGHRLAVASVLEGSVQRAGDRVRISAHLIRTSDGFQQWSKTFDRELWAIFEIQDEIARVVVAEVGPQLRRRDQGFLVETATENPEAYDLYLLGFRGFRKQTRAGLEEALERVQQAIELDPGFAEAHWFKGMIHHFLVVNGYRSREGWAEAEAAHRRALAIDDDLAAAHATLGEIRGYNWDWEAAEEHGRRAIELAPGSFLAHMTYSQTLSMTGRTRQAVEHLERARRLDPLGPLINRNLGIHLLYDRQYDRAIKQLRHSLALSGELPFTRLVLQSACWYSGDFEQWAQELQQIYRVLGSKREAERIGDLFASSGPRAVLRWWAAHLTASEEHAEQLGRVGDPNGWWSLAHCHLWLGDLDAGFAVLDRLVEERSVLVARLKVDALFDGLRDDPRYIAFLRRMNLAD